MFQNKVIITLILLGLISFTLAQVDTAWVRRYNGTGYGLDSANAIAVDDSGNVYVTGSTVGTGTGNDWTTIKYNPNGDTVWVRNYFSPGYIDERARSIAIGNSGNIYITGYGSGSDTADFLTIKYNPAGETLWTQRTDGPEQGFDFATSIALDDSENVYVCGYTEGYNISDYDYLIIKLNSSGNLIWERFYTSSTNQLDKAKIIKVDWLGNVYVTGTSSPLGSSNSDYTTISYRRNGDFRWYNTYIGPIDSTDIVHAMVLDDSGNIYITGASMGSDTLFDFATIKYTPLGETVWVRRYNDSLANNDDEGYGVAVDNWGNVIVTGSSIGSGTDYDYATVKYNHLGAQQWVSKYMGPVDEDVANGGIKVDDQGNIYVTGYSAGTGTNFDFTTIKYNPTGNTQWVARYDGSANNNDQTKDIKIDGYGNVYVTGLSTSTGPNLDWATIKYIQPGYVVRDVAPIAIVSPLPVVAPGTPIVPACSVYNYGDTIETYLVRMKIGAFYEDTVRVFSHNPGTYQYLTFTTWNANQLGFHMVACSTELLFDGFKRNDKKTSTVVVGTADAEVVRILSPTGTIDTLPVVPRARIRNNSSVTLPIPVFFTIFKDSVVYTDARIVNLPSGATYDVPFATFYLTGSDTGDYTTEVSVSVLGDQDPGNDTQTGAFTVVIYEGGPGWQAMAPVPSAPSGKLPKSGSCMASMRDYIYFLKASNTNDFYIYTPDACVGIWTAADTIPKGIKDYGDGKRPKRGAAMTAYQQEHAIYVLRGNNTVGFWKYQADTVGELAIGWYKLANIPLITKKCKYGSGLVSFRKHGDGFIFAMKGAKTDEFYIYHIEGDSWTRVSSPPIGTSGRFGYKKGSVLAYDGNEFVYVLQGYYGSFFKYSVDGDSWHQLKQYNYKIFLNRDGRKKKPKDGAALAYYEDNIYLLKGGNTLEFWKYEIATDSWIQMNPGTTWDIPIGGGKKVKDGGCMTIHDNFFFVAKGKKTNEFYRHLLPTATTSSMPNLVTNEGVTGKKVDLGSFNLTIAPNPAINLTAVRYSLPKAEPVSFKLFDITGSMVKSYTNTNPTKQGVIMIDTKTLSSGVYILRFNSGDIKVTRKLVLQK